LYYLSAGSFKLDYYTNSRKYCDEQSNRQLAHLRKIIEDRMSKEGMIAIAISGGVWQWVLLP
jgi:fission 1 protein